ncbi:MAG TPA: hypothetical protein VK921_04375 [Anditalea sp.]|nr:hypothetical protein [Anditalea sp.]
MKTTGLFKGYSITVLMILAVTMSHLSFGQTVPRTIEKTLNIGQIPIEKGMVILSRDIKLKPEVDSKVFDNWINEYWNLEWEDLIPGIQSYVAKSENGLDKLYAYFLVFKPAKLSSSISFGPGEDLHMYREFIYYEPTKHLYDELFEYIEIEPFLTNISRFESK